MIADYRVAAIDYDPLPVFTGFHQCELREGAIIGGYGSGKTVALCAEALKQALRQPGSEWIIARQTVNSLRDTTEKVFFSLLPGEFLAQCETTRGGGHYQNITLPNGSVIHFKSLDDWHKWKSMNIAGFFLDEADEISQDAYEGLITRVRQVHPLKGAVGAAPYIRSGFVRIAMNPAGHDYYWDRFINHAQKTGPKEYFTPADDPAERRLAFLSTSLDNPYNPSSYLNHLLSFPEPWIKRYVFCSFDNFEGVIYPEWDWQSHTVDPFFAYNPSSMFLMGMDPGTQNPTAAMWCYEDKEKGMIIGVAEYLQAGVAVTPHVQAWRKIERNGTHNMSRHPGQMNVRRRIADPSIATRDRGSMMALETQLERKGFYFEHGPKNIPDRLPALGELIHAGRFKVTKELELAYEQIKNYRYEDLTPLQIERGVEAKPFKKNVDIVDAAQYIASRWRSPVAQRPVKQERPKEQLRDMHDVELKLRAKALREAGLLMEADSLEQELVPELTLRDQFQRDLQARKSRERRPTEHNAGLA